MRVHKKIQVVDENNLKRRLLQWAQQFEEVVWMDSNQGQSKYSSYEALLAVEAFTAISTEALGAFSALQEYQENSGDWIVGYLSYDLKNDVEALTSNNTDELDFPDLFFFQPKKLFLLSDGCLELKYLKLVEDEMERDLAEILNTVAGNPAEDLEHFSNVPVSPRISRTQYQEKVEKILQHISRGDIYEMNFCQEFFATGASIEPIPAFRKLNALSQPPFACFLRLYDKYVLSASPERYLKKKGRKILSQPIKGTAPRGKNPEEDKELVENLARDPKEIAENTMIVDLVRNDLSRTADKGTVSVPELCKVYTFPQVHQMISTVESRIREGVSGVEAIKNSFPMGSMTGAPKVAAMDIIEVQETAKRGVYSGAVGYFTPEGDFDFNVIIRSILYNQSRQYVSFHVGGAITSKSDPQLEYEECLVKAGALRETLGSK